MAAAAAATAAAPEATYDDDELNLTIFEDCMFDRDKVVQGDVEVNDRLSPAARAVVMQMAHTVADDVRAFLESRRDKPSQTPMQLVGLTPYLYHMMSMPVRTYFRKRADARAAATAAPPLSDAAEEYLTTWIFVDLVQGPALVEFKKAIRIGRRRATKLLSLHRRRLRTPTWGRRGGVRARGGQSTSSTSRRRLHVSAATAAAAAPPVPAASAAASAAAAAVEEEDGVIVIE